MIYILTYVWLLAASAVSASSSPYSRLATRADHSLSLSKRYVDTFRAGAIIDILQETTNYPAILSVAATWNIPSILPNPGAALTDVTNQQEMAQWVGITGGECGDHAGGALLQAGTDSRLTETGETVANAWIEWLPAGSFLLSSQNMTVHPGDIIRFSIRVDSEHSGFIKIKNLSTGQAWADTLVDPFFLSSPGSDAGSSMCLGNGTAWFIDEWVLGVPGAAPDSQRRYLPVFENVTFSDVEARGRLGRRFDLGSPSADYWNMTQRGTGKPVAVSEPRDRDSFVLYSPEGKGWEPEVEVEVEVEVEGGK